MTDLAKNNLDAQVDLMKDIISNYKGIVYGVTQAGKNIREILKERTTASDGKSVTFSKESYDKLYDIMCHLEDERKFNRLGVLAEMAVPDNQIKLKILQTLQK